MTSDARDFTFTWLKAAKSKAQGVKYRFLLFLVGFVVSKLS